MRVVSLALLAAVLAAAGSITLAPAQSPPRDARPHLLVVPATAAGTAALGRTDARTVARYDSFSLVEAAGDDVERLRRAGADRRDDMRTVATAAGAIDPAVERASLAAKGAPDRERTLALVQFIGPPKDAWLERLRATGARLVGYQAENAYVVHARGDAVDRLAALQGGDPAVRAVSVLTAADKLEDRTSETGVFAVTTVAGAAGADARDVGEPRGAPLTAGALRTVYRALSPAEAARLATDPGVVAVEAHVEPELFDERAAQIVAGNLTAPALSQPAEPPAYRDWLEDKGIDDTTFDFAIDVTDTGLDNGAVPTAHPDFHGRVPYMANYTADADARDCVGHGTNVASIAAGSSSSTGAAYEDAQGFDHGLGVAPSVRVGVSKLFNCAGGAPASYNPGALSHAAYAGGARISNNSWGTATMGDYTPLSAAFDSLVRDASAAAGLQPLVEVVAAGNEGNDGGYGTIGDPGSAKNVITVGASEGVRASGSDGCGVTNEEADSARDIPDFSSRGPTDDGRRKPDIVAPGSHVVGAAPQHAGYNAGGVCTKYLGGTTWYSVVSGTSQAAPQVSGAAALVRRWYQGAHGAPPSPALTKALLVNTATDLAGGQNGKGGTLAAGPNDDQGWGRVNVGSVFDGTLREFRDQIPADELAASGAQRVRAYTVDDPEAPVKITLAWTDAPGPTTGDPVVNDLDLVVDAGGRTYKGNVFDGAFSRTGGAADPRNNVESVYLPAGTSGRFAVRVVGANIAGDGVPNDIDGTDQDYALVVSNGGAAAAPVLVHDATTVNDLGDADGALEPGEPFALDERLANAGEAGAAGVSGTLAGGSLALTQAASSWPAIAAGATGTNATRFAGTLAAGATCGADVAATLSLTAPGGPQTVPLTLPTGAAGPAVASTRAHSPRLVIPDDDAAGVTSTIDVPTAGMIKDVDVRIADIDHGWVGDLRIDVVAPDGTTVTLVDHVGGPDNVGDDFVATVFDDEAASTIASGTAPYTGRFRPQGDQLARFDGKQQQGVWTLRVRDLARSNAGTVGAWGIDTSPATCAIATLTTIDAGPAQGATAARRDPTFEFSSEVGGATFECRLDGAAYEPCTSPKTYGGLADGPHTFEVRSVVGQNADPTPATRTWTIDGTAPSTTLTDGPAGRVSSTNASFAFAAAGATFECSLDSATFAACTSPRTYGGLADGEHTFRVRARDAVGNIEVPPKTRSWTVDTTAPAPAVTAPVDGARISGTAGTAAGDANAVTVTIYDGATAVRTLPAVRDAAGTWSVEVTPPLPPGAYTVSAAQADDAVPTNVGQSPAVAFQVVAGPAAPPNAAPPPPPPPAPAADAPSFVLAPAEEVAGRLTVVAACASACTMRADLSGLGAGSTSLAEAGTATARVRLNARGRAALRRRSATRATLRVTLAVGGRTLTLNRAVTIRRSAGTRRIAARGLSLWAVCSERCPLRASLRVSGRGVVADGRTVATPDSAARLQLRVRPRARPALRKARRAVLEAVAGHAPTRTATHVLTLGGVR